VVQRTRVTDSIRGTVSAISYQLSAISYQLSAPPALPACSWAVGGADS
jgi:hypothetical protein